MAMVIKTDLMAMVIKTDLCKAEKHNSSCINCSTCINTLSALKDAIEQELNHLEQKALSKRHHM